MGKKRNQYTNEVCFCKGSPRSISSRSNVCQILGVGNNGFYAQLNRPEIPQSQENRRFEDHLPAERVAREIVGTMLHGKFLPHIKVVLIHGKNYNTRQKPRRSFWIYRRVLQSATPLFLSRLSQSGRLQERECDLINCPLISGRSY